MSLNQAWLFLGAWLLLAAIELKRPLRSSKIPKRFRWLQNMILGVLGWVGFYLVLGLPFWLWATWVDYHGWGLFPLLPVPSLLKTLFTILIFDLAFYGFHRWMHRSPWFWKIHQVHHSDLNVDVSTSIRFHPFEILAMGLLRLVLITVLGVSRDAVLTYDGLYMLALLGAHANIQIAPRWDRNLKKFLVTPSYHQLHHAQNPKAYHSNYAFIFSFWDRFLGTVSRPMREVHLGLAQYPRANQLRWDYLLKIPFRD